jgi:Tfp pilus assembly protein PilE
MQKLQTGFTLGQLAIAVVVVAAIAVGGAAWHKRNNLRARIILIESFLVDSKERLNASMLDQDNSATLGDALKKYDDNAAKADEAIVELRKLGTEVGATHIEKAINILAAARNLMRYQRKLTTLHIQARSLMAEVDASVSLARQSNLAGDLVAQYRPRVEEVKNELDIAGKERLDALEQLLTATRVASTMFSSKALIDVSAYEALLNALRGQPE